MLTGSGFLTRQCGQLLGVAMWSSSTGHHLHFTSARVKKFMQHGKKVPVINKLLAVVRYLSCLMELPLPPSGCGR